MTTTTIVLLHVIVGLSISLGIASFIIFRMRRNHIKKVEELNALIDECTVTHDRLLQHNNDISNAYNRQNKYIADVIQPSVFRNRAKFMTLDGITYEFFTAIDIITKTPEKVNIMPTDLWDQIIKECTKAEMYEVVNKLQEYPKRYPMKFTKLPFYEAFMLSPIFLS